MILTTTNSIEHHKIVDYLGIVTGISLKYPKSGITFSIKKYYDSVSNEMENVKEEAIKKLKENAVNLNANAVVGIQVDIEITQAGVTTVSVTGTAVKVVFDNQ